MDVSNFISKPKERKFCLQCKREIKPDSTRFKVRKFCSTRCNRRYFSLKRYYKIKDDKDYKDYRREYYKEWLDKNRDKFNKSMRTISLRYQQRKKIKDKIKDKIKNKMDKDKEINKIKGG